MNAIQKVQKLGFSIFVDMSSYNKSLRRTHEDTGQILNLSKVVIEEQKNTPTLSKKRSKKERKKREAEWAKLDTKMAKKRLQMRYGWTGWNKWNKRCSTLKIGMIGDYEDKAQLFKSCFEDENNHTSKTIECMAHSMEINNTIVILDAWDLKSSCESINLLPSVCNGANVVLFVFDLMDETTLLFIPKYYRWIRKQNTVKNSYSGLRRISSA